MDRCSATAGLRELGRTDERREARDMTTNGKFNGVVADADGHIMEPGDLWSENLEPKYRDRAMQVVRGDDGLDFLQNRRQQVASARRSVGFLGQPG